MSDTAQDLNLQQAMRIGLGPSGTFKSERKHHTPEAIAKRLGSLLDDVRIGEYNTLIIAVMLISILNDERRGTAERLKALAALKRNARKVSEHFIISALPELLQDAIGNAHATGLEAALELVE